MNAGGADASSKGGAVRLPETLCSTRLHHIRDPMNIVDKIITSQLEIFATNFSNVAHSIFYDENTQSLIHPGEYGMLRESVVRDLLTHFLPESFGVSQGFVVSPDGSVSNQCDIIIYSKLFSPKIHTAEQQRFFPVESVLAVGEVKSTADPHTLKSALEKLIRVKEMRANLKNGAVAWSVFRDIGPYNALEHHLDQIGTFLIANSFSCSKQKVAETIRDSAIGKHPTFQVNLVVSIKDYLVNYIDNKGTLWMFPVDVDDKRKIIPIPLPLSFSSPTDTSFEHLKLFLRYLEILVLRTSILYPEFTSYLGGFSTLNTTHESELQKP